MGLEMAKGCDFKGFFVGGFKDDIGGEAGAAGFFPARRAQAPAVPGLEAGESELWAGGGEIVADCLAEGEKLCREDGADGVEAAVLRVGIAAAIAVPAGERACAA